MEKRVDKRLNKNLLVYVKEDGLNLLGVASNVSKNGLFVESIRVFPETSELAFVLAISNDLYHMKGEVAWNNNDDNGKDKSVGPSGMGIRITEAPVEYLNYINYISRGMF